MFRTTRTYGVNWLGKAAKFLFGILCAFIGACAFEPDWGESGLTMHWTFDFLRVLGACFVLAGLLIMFLGGEITVFPEERRVVRKRRWLGVPFRRRSWEFSEISKVQLLLQSTTSYSDRTDRTTTVYSTTLQLITRSSDPIFLEGGGIGLWGTGKTIPEETKAQARELAETIGVPLEILDGSRGA